MSTSELDKISVPRLGKREFLHPVWGSKCPDYLKILPNKPLAKMSPPEIERFIRSHGAHFHGYHEHYIAHNVRVHHFPINQDAFFEFTQARDDWWDSMGIEDEIANAQYLDNGGWKDYTIHTFGRSGGWAGLAEVGGKGRSDPPVNPEILETRVSDFIPDEAEREYGHKYDEAEARDGLLAVARPLMWFDITVNACLHDVVCFCDDIVIGEEEVTTVKRVTVPTFKSKLDPGVTY